MQESETQKDPPIFVLCVSACCSTSREIPLSLFPPLIRIPIALFPKKDRQREIDPKREREGARRKSVAVVAAADCLIFCCGEELAQSPISNHNAQDGNSTANRGSLELSTGEHALSGKMFSSDKNMFPGLSFIWIASKQREWKLHKNCSKQLFDLCPP